MIDLSATGVIARVLADDGDGGEGKKAGPIGLVVIVLLCVACYFLFKSMSRHLKKVRDDFPTTLPADPLHPDVRSTPKASAAKTSVRPVEAADPGAVATGPPGPPGTGQRDGNPASAG
jgi:hypothetical protein